MSSPLDMPVEVTVVVPTYNAFGTLAEALPALAWKRQGLPLKALLRDNSSDDPCADFVRPESALERWMVDALGFAGARCLPPLGRLTRPPFEKPMPTRNANLEAQWTGLTAAVETPFVWYVDADVIAPPGAGRAMLDALKADESLALVGVQYDRRVDHVKMGCALGRTADMKALGQWRSEGCPCRWVGEALEKAGRGVRYLDPDRWGARHVKGAV